jgi:hypothetical protein
MKKSVLPPETFHPNEEEIRNETAKLLLNPFVKYLFPNDPDSKKGISMQTLAFWGFVASIVFVGCVVVGAVWEYFKNSDAPSVTMLDTNIEHLKTSVIALQNEREILKSKHVEMEERIIRNNNVWLDKTTELSNRISQVEEKVEGHEMAWPKKPLRVVIEKDGTPLLTNEEVNGDSPKAASLKKKKGLGKGIDAIIQKYPDLKRKKK